MTLTHKTPNIIHAHHAGRVFVIAVPPGVVWSDEEIEAAVLSKAGREPRA